MIQLENFIKESFEIIKNEKEYFFEGRRFVD
jgi:hypothetical protein